MTLEVSPASAPGAASAWLKSLDRDRERERRAHERLAVHQLEWLKSVRLKFGPAISLIDLSVGGALVETSAPLRPGSTAALTIVGRGVAQTATFRVLRCQVSSLDGGLIYRGACVFDRMIALPEAAAGATAAQRLEETYSASQPNAIDGFSSAVLAGSAELQEVLRLIRAAADRPVENDDLGAPLAPLVGDIDAALRRGDAPEAVLASIERRLGRKLSQLASAPSSTWVDPVERTQPRVAAIPSPTGSGSGWNKLVVRYLDGRLLKGFSQDFHPSRAHFHLSPTIGGVTRPPVLVPMPRLKAVFFVREFDGDADYVERKSFVEPLPGRRIEVTFLDDEVLIGATLGYRPDGTGFFVSPADPNGNNLRIFVLPGGVRHIRYL